MSHGTLNPYAIRSFFRLNNFLFHLARVYLLYREHLFPRPPSSTFPAFFLLTPSHCLKKYGTPTTLFNSLQASVSVHQKKYLSAHLPFFNVLSTALMTSGLWAWIVKILLIRFTCKTHSFHLNMATGAAVYLVANVSKQLYNAGIAYIPTAWHPSSPATWRQAECQA